MAKVTTEYYNLEKVAEVLSVSTAEVNRLREQNKLRGFRDGTNWKFQKEDIHNYLAQTIKARSGNAGNGQNAGESDFDLLGGNASASSFDLLVENADSLPNDSQLLSVNQQTANQQKGQASDHDLAALDNNDDDLSLAEETRISSVPIAPKPKKPKIKEDSVIMNVVGEEDSDLALAPAAKSDSVLLDDNDSVLGAAGSSPQLGLAGDSGFDMLVAGDDDSDLLEVDVDDERTAPVFVPKEDFVLEPAKPAGDADESDSSSQIIAIGSEFGEAEPDLDPFGGSFSASDFAGLDSGIQQPSATAGNDPFGQGTSDFAEDFSEGFTPPVQPDRDRGKKPQVTEEEYSTGTLVALISTLVVMLLPGLMLIDTMVHIWSWNDPFVLNSVLMDVISGWFGL